MWLALNDVESGKVFAVNMDLVLSFCRGFEATLSDLPLSRHGEVGSTLFSSEGTLLVKETPKEIALKMGSAASQVSDLYAEYNMYGA